MSMPVLKVELFFNLDVLPTGALLLDDPVFGVLDSGAAKLAGAGYVDVTAYIKNISISRGKSRMLDRFNAGTAQIDFNNSNRYFDPKYAASPFYGAIVPRQKVRISADNNYVFVGYVNDWNITYDPAGPSFATADCVDGFSNLTRQKISARTNIVQYSGERVATILDLPEVNWPSTERNINTGAIQLQADTIDADTEALGYLQQVETTEQGDLFVGRDGFLNFVERGAGYSFDVFFADDGTGIFYKDIEVIYGTELLYNRVELTKQGSPTPYVENDITSQDAYGISTLNLNTLHQNNTDVQNMADYLLSNYAQPEYRFGRVGIEIAKIPDADKLKVLTLDFGQLAQIKFTPSKIPPAIEQWAEIISINHQITPQSYIVSVGFGSDSYVPFVLDSNLFGVLDSNKLGY